MINIEQFKIEIKETAKEYLSEINEENLKEFAEKTKWIVNKYIQNYYVNKESQIIGDEKFGIKDENVRDQFMDLVDGYRSKMEQWVANNSIQIREVKIEPSPLSLEIDNKMEKTEIDFQSICDHVKNNKTIYIACAGLTVAAGIFIFHEMWVALAVELLFMSSTIYSHVNNKKDKEERDNEGEIEYKKRELEFQKDRMVNGIIDDLIIWLKNGLKYSHQLLESYGLKTIDESEYI